MNKAIDRRKSRQLLNMNNSCKYDKLFNLAKNISNTLPQLSKNDFWKSVGGISMILPTVLFIRFLFKDSQILCYKKFVKNSTDLLVR